MTTTNDAGIDGDTLDEIADVLTERYEKRKTGEIDADEQAITSGELADRITGETAEANPKTREAVKILMREREYPIVSGNKGYWIPVDPSRVEQTLDAWDQRINGIKERKTLLAQNWRAWRDGSDDNANNPGIPQAVRECIGQDTVDRPEVVHEVSDRTGRDVQDIEDRLDELKRQGFVYQSGEGLRLP